MSITRGWRVTVGMVVGVLALSTALADIKRAPRRAGLVTLSDGTTLEGAVFLTPGWDFHLTGLPESGKVLGAVSTFNVDVVQDLTFTPFSLSKLEPERMILPFKWDPNDRTQKIPIGKEPYPVRELKCVARLSDGSVKQGVLKTTVLYVQPSGLTTGMPGRVGAYTLESKQTGKPGQKLADMVYVTNVRMLDEGRVVRRETAMALPESLLGPEDPLFALTRASLAPVAVRREGPGRYTVTGALGEPLFLAARQGGRYMAGWPAAGTDRAGLFESVEKKVLALPDYFNERKLLGIMANADATEILTLLSLRRRVPANAFSGEGNGEFDDAGKPMEFFRLSVWLWHRDRDTGSMSVVRRGSFLRVRVDAGAPTPEVVVNPALWQETPVGDQHP